MGFTWDLWDETDIFALENQRLEDDSFPFGSRSLFRGTLVPSPLDLLVVRWLEKVPPKNVPLRMVV